MAINGLELNDSDAKLYIITVSTSVITSVSLCHRLYGPLSLVQEEIVLQFRGPYGVKSRVSDVWNSFREN